VGDWGMRAMTYVGFFAISPTGRLYLYRELAWTGVKISEWAPIVRDIITREKPKSVKFCKSAGQDRGTEHTVRQQIEEALEVNVELSDNSPGSRIAGKQIVHEYLRWKQRPIIPPSEMPKFDEGYAMWLMRNKGQREYDNYLKIFDPIEEEDNIPRLQIFNTCPLMVVALQSCSYEKAGKDGKKPEDVAEFEGDDPYDTLRYACDSAENYFQFSAAEFARVQQQEILIRTLRNTEDWTAFYRNMNRVEGSNKMKVVKAFHRKRLR
jgi:hypothetical protein